MNDWKVFALGSAFFAALTAVFAKVGVAQINSNFATLIRTLLISLLVAVIMTYRQEWASPSSIDRKTWIFLILSASGLSWLCYYRALQIGAVSKVAPIDKMSLALTIILSVVFLGEKLDIKTFLATALIFSGTLILVL